MKQIKKVSMIGALVLIISAVTFITGCSQPNSNGGNTGNNGGNTGNNGGNTGNNGGNTGNNGGGTSQGLEGGVFRFPVSDKPGQEIYYYFSNGTVYYAGKESGYGWIKYNVGSYQGNKLLINGETRTVTVSAQGITADGQLYQRITDQGIINTIKNLPVSSMPSNG